MADILTLTMNPAIDMSTTVDRVEPTRKLRCAEIERDPGGGGINVARIARRLGADVAAIYPVGGEVGRLLRHLVDDEDIESITFPVAGETREDFTALEMTTGDQYRFVMTGPRFSETEWKRAIEALARYGQRPALIVASGSLPPGVPDDFYARIAEIARRRRVPMMLDSSGRALKAALGQGLFLIKLNLQELQDLVEASLPDEASRVEACEDLVASGQAQAVALTLGDRGAVLVTADGAWRAAPLPLKPASTVGAGDSFLGGMAWALSSGRGLDDAFRYGVAAGSAAVLTAGTELCRAEDVWRLVERVAVDRLDVRERAPSSG